MTETRRIVVLGASFAGIAISQYICKHLLPQLKNSKDAKYELHIINPSTHFWWHIAAVREIVSVKEMPHEKCFVPVMDGFKQYSDLKDSIHFLQGTAVAVDTESRNVTIKTHEGGQETLSYYSLIIATGVRTPTPLTHLQGDHTISQRALEQMNKDLVVANDIVIAGGGPIAVETAGEIATHLPGKARITLVAGGKKLLPILSEARGTKAQKMLEKIGVTVMYNTKVTGSTETGDGKTEVQLDNGTTLTTDVYIPAVGVTPNTEFLPPNLRDKNNRVATNGKTLRVDAAGPLVYAAGDVTGVDNGGVMKLYGTIPILGANITHDLLKDAKVGTPPAERSYVRKDDETQLVPIGAKTGVGAFNGFGMPGFAISMIKGKDFFLKTMPDITEGKKFVKA